MQNTPYVTPVRNVQPSGCDNESFTVVGWVDACWPLLPLEEALRDYVLTDGKLHADDTPVPVLLLGN